MFTLGIVELERASHRLQHALGRARQVPALEARVVVDADAGEQGNLLPAQPGDAALPPVVRKSGTLRRDPCAPRRQEVPDVLAMVHELQAKSLSPALRGTAITWNDSHCQPAGNRR